MDKKITVELFSNTIGPNYMSITFYSSALRILTSLKLKVTVQVNVLRVGGKGLNIYRSFKRLRSLLLLVLFWVIEKNKTIINSKEDSKHEH